MGTDIIKSGLFQLRFLFVLLTSILCTFIVNARSVSGYYWIDNGSPTTFSSDQNFISVQTIPDGLHSLTVYVTSDQGVWSDPLTRCFIKVPMTVGDSSMKGVVIIDGRSSETVTLTPQKDGIYLIDYDVSDLAVGLHSLSFLSVSKGGSSSLINQTWFYRAPTHTDLGGAQLVYFIDGKEVGRSKCNYDDGLYTLDIDAEGLTSGIHSIDMAIVLPNGNATQTVSSWFYKLPCPGGIANYEYWFNDDYSTIQRVGLENAMADFKLITMLDIPELPFCSKRYDFSIENGVPTISNVNHLSMRFFDSDGRPTYSEAMFADSRTSRPILDALPLNVGANRVAPFVENEIKWYKFEGEIGDSIAMRAQRAVMYELYSPSGTEVTSRVGSHAETLNTCTLNETGQYHLAIHDANPSGMLDFGFSHVPRNAILKVNPNRMGSSNIFGVVDIYGNGLSNAKSIVLENSNGARYEVDKDEFYAFDNYNLSVSFEFDNQLPIGSYSLSVVIDDPVTGTEEMLTMADAINVVDSEALSDVAVEVVPTLKPGTPYMVDIKVTNNSDMACWGVPVNIACDRDRGRNGFVFYISDFLGKPMTAEHLSYYETDNLLNTGKDGLFFPLNLTYLHPHETRVLKVGIVSDPHKQVGLYAWAGMPFSDEAAQILATPRDTLAAMPVMYSNILDIKTTAYIQQAIEEISEKTLETMRVHPKANNQVLETLRDYAPDAIGRYKPLEKPSGYADKAADLSVGYAKTYAGITNSTAGYHCYNYFKNEEHIPGNTLSEQVAYIDMLYGGPEGIPPGSLQIYYQQAKNTLGRNSSPEDIAMEAFDVEWLQAVKDFLFRNGECPNPMPSQHLIDVLMSGDPNMITGYSDLTGGNYVGLGVNTLDYTIEFENDPAIANVPACTVKVTNHLDKGVFDLSTFQPKNLQIGSHIVELPSEQSFVKTIDMRPEIQCIAEIRLNYSDETGVAAWTFMSLDPMTMLPVENYRQGLLPVNDESDVGIGRITYSIKLLSGLEHMMSFGNSASIVFDSNDPVVTEPWVNVTDYIRPKACIVKNNGYNGTAYELDIEYSDDGSGVMYYDLYARVGGNGTWGIVQGGLSECHIEYPVQEPIDGLEFMVRATDCAGNRQLEGGTVASIDEISPDVFHEENVVDEKWYNLQGIPQEKIAVPTSPGILISTKGRKVIVK